MKLLGTLKKDNIKGYFELDFSLLHCRIFIHKCQVDKKPVSFIIFLNRLKKEVEMEKMLLGKEHRNLVPLGNIESLL